MRTAPTSLVASDRCAFRMVGACHHSSDNGPLPPGRFAAAARAIGAAAPTVAASVGALVGLVAGTAVAGAAVGWLGAAGPHAESNATAPSPSVPWRRKVRRFMIEPRNRRIHHVGQSCVA